VLDANDKLEKQDLQIARLVHDEGRVLIIAANKWDSVEDKVDALKMLKRRVEFSLGGEIAQRLGAGAHQRHVVLLEFRQQEREALLFRLRILPDLRAIERALVRLLDQRQGIRGQALPVGQRDPRRIGHLQRLRRDVVPGARFAEPGIGRERDVWRYAVVLLRRKLLRRGGLEAVGTVESTGVRGGIGCADAR